MNPKSHARFSWKLGFINPFPTMIASHRGLFQKGPPPHELHLPVSDLSGENCRVSRCASTHLNGDDSCWASFKSIEIFWNGKGFHNPCMSLQNQSGNSHTFMVDYENWSKIFTQILQKETCPTCIAPEKMSVYRGHPKSTISSDFSFLFHSLAVSNHKFPRRSTKVNRRVAKVLLKPCLLHDFMPRFLLLKVEDPEVFKQTENLRFFDELVVEIRSESVSTSGVEIVAQGLPPSFLKIHLKRHHLT